MRKLLRISITKEMDKKNLNLKCIIYINFIRNIIGTTSVYIHILSYMKLEIAKL